MRSERAEQRLRKIRNLITPYHLEFSGVRIYVHPNVYPTSELSEIVVECMDDSIYGISLGDHILDYGTGTGFLAINAALRGAKVVATDVNPYAIECARYNVESYKLESQIELRLGRSFECIRADERFDIILAGVPWDDAEPLDFLEMAMFDSGFGMKKDLFLHGNKALKEGGRIFLTYSEFAQKLHPIEKFDRRYTYTVLKKRDIKGSPHFVYMIKPKV